MCPHDFRLPTRRDAAQCNNGGAGSLTIGVAKRSDEIGLTADAAVVMSRVDMERELRARPLPLVSLESARPLSDFEVEEMRSASNLRVMERSDGEILAPTATARLPKKAHLKSTPAKSTTQPDVAQDR